MGPDPILAQQLAGERAGLETISNICHGWIGEIGHNLISAHSVGKKNGEVGLDLNLAFMPRLDDVFGLYTKMLFGMGLVFQMPAVVFFLAKMGLVTARFLLVNFKYAFLLIFIAAAVITPSGDAATQALFAAPMVGLYIIGIVIAWIVGPVAKRASEDQD